MVVSTRMIPPIVSPVKRSETNISPTTIETDRAIRLALAAQRRAMQKALSEAAR
jgi:hypothetical protein